MYENFISKKKFNGTPRNLMKEVIEAFVNEGIVKSKLGEFYNIAGIIETEDSEDIAFNIGIVSDVDGILEEGVIEENVISVLLPKFKQEYRELYIDGQVKTLRKAMLDSNIKATYTLFYS